MCLFPIILNSPNQKRKKEPRKFDRGPEDLILDFMEGNECLWNPGHQDWMKQDVKEKAWNNIGAILQCDGVDVRTWWNTNKDRYVREHKKTKSGSGSKVLSARMQWLMTKFSFYSKVVTHHQKPVVSVKASIAQREERDPSAEPEDDPGPRGGSLLQHLLPVQIKLSVRSSNILRLLKNNRGSYWNLSLSRRHMDIMWALGWLAWGSMQAFDNARTVINDLISVTSRRTTASICSTWCPSSRRALQPHQ